MGARLKATTVVGGQRYTAGTEVPDDVAALITNPAVLEREPEDADPDALPEGLVIAEDGVVLIWRGENYVRQTEAIAEVGRVSDQRDAIESEAEALREQLAVLTEAQSTNDAQPPAATEPPRSGPGSGIEAWRTYAGDLDGVEVPDGASRDEIIAAVDAAK